MTEKNKTALLLSIATVLSVFVLAISIINRYEYKLLLTQNKSLIDENMRLEMDLIDSENKIYELNLELSTTERALADTAYALDEVKEELEAQRNLQLNYVGEYYCTAYCVEKYPHICGGGGNTASGAPVTADVSVAVTDLQKLPYGTIIYIENVGIRIVQDTGGFSKNKIDVAVKTHKEANNWKGQGKHKVYIINIEDEKD